MLQDITKHTEYLMTWKDVPHIGPHEKASSLLDFQCDLLPQH